MRERLTSVGVMPLVSWAGLLISATGLIGLIVASIINGEWAAFGAVLFSLLVVLFGIRQLWRRHRPVELEETTVFHPFTPLSPDNAWPRGDVDGIVASLLEKHKAMPLVVGASGVGKSTLLNVLVKEKIEATRPDVDYMVISSHYADIVKQLEDLIAGCSRRHPRVIVLDQFEQWLALVEPKDYPERQRCHAALRKILKKAKRRRGCAVVISVRSEWYFDLSFLGDLVPDPTGVYAIDAPALTAENDPMRVAIRRSFLDVLGEDQEELVDEVMRQLSPSGRLSPLKAQIVGAVLERRQEAAVDVDLEYFEQELGGVRDVIDTYFREALDGSERPHLCVKILFALSVKQRFRTKTKLSTLVDTLYEDTEPIKTALAYLREQGLVIKLGTGTYAIAHDFLAEFFSTMSGAELHPVDRDNIQIYTTERGKHSSAVNARARRAIRSRRSLGPFYVASLLLLMTARFFYFGVETNLVGNAELARPLIGNLFDTTYLLIMVPYAAWIVYVGLFYDRLLVHLSESKIQRFFTIFTMLNLAISVVLGILVPYAWLIGIASAGMLFGVKMLLLSRNKEITRAARKRLREYSMPTVINMIIAGAAGIADLVLSLLYVDSHASVNTWIWSNLAVSLMVTYWCLMVATMHVSRKGIAQLLGLIGRPGSVANESLED